MMIETINQTTKNDISKNIDDNVDLTNFNFVLWDTPIILKNKQTNNIMIKKISDINDINQYQIWCEKGWDNIKKIVKQKITCQKIYRIMTYTGIVDIFESNNLYNMKMENVMLEQIKIGTSLLHSFPNYFHCNQGILTKNKSFIYGQFFGDDINLEYKEVPNIMLNAQVEDIFAFIEGILTTNKYYNNFNRSEKKRIVVLGKMATQGLYYLLKKIGYNVLITMIQDDMYCLEFSTIIYECENKVKNVQQTPKTLFNKNQQEESTYATYVYSIETQNGKFNAGVGRLIL